MFVILKSTISIKHFVRVALVLHGASNLMFRRDYRLTSTYVFLSRVPAKFQPDTQHRSPFVEDRWYEVPRLQLA